MKKKVFKFFKIIYNIIKFNKTSIGAKKMEDDKKIEQKELSKLETIATQILKKHFSEDVKRMESALKALDVMEVEEFLDFIGFGAEVESEVEETDSENEEPILGKELSEEEKKEAEAKAKAEQAEKAKNESDEASKKSEENNTPFGGVNYRK